MDNNATIQLVFLTCSNCLYSIDNGVLCAPECCVTLKGWDWAERKYGYDLHEVGAKVYNIATPTPQITPQMRERGRERESKHVILDSVNCHDCIYACILILKLFLISIHLQCTYVVN